MSRARVLLSLLLLVPVAACDNGPLDPTTTTDSTTTTTTSPVTETWSTQLAVNGTTSRSFTAAKAGTATVTLTSVGGSTTQKIGFGIGIPDTLGAGCLFTRSLETAAGAQISTAVDFGTYCVRVYDLGTLTATTAITVTIVRP